MGQVGWVCTLIESSIFVCNLKIIRLKPTGDIGCRNMDVSNSY